jgi:hypothetical protein
MNWHDLLEISGWILTLVFGVYGWTQGRKVLTANRREASVRRQLQLQRGARLVDRTSSAAVLLHTRLEFIARTQLHEDALRLTADTTRAIASFGSLLSHDQHRKIESAQIRFGSILQTLRSSTAPVLAQPEKQEVRRLALEAILELESLAGQLENSEMLNTNTHD